MSSKTVFKMLLCGLLSLLVFPSFAADNYPVVLKGPRPLRGWSVRRLEAFARHGSVWQRIPLQVDEVNHRGDFVLAGGLPFTSGTDDGILDDNDEIVLWGGDLGDEFTNADIPKNLRIAPDSGKFWKLSLFRHSQPIGTVLIIGLKKDPAKFVATPHVAFDKKTGTISSSLYDYHFATGNPALLGAVLLNKDGRKVPVISDSQFVMPLKTPWYLPNMNFDSSDFTSSIESWQIGPIRTIVAVGVKYTAFLSLFKLHLFSELIFYRNKFEIPTVIEFVFDPSKHLKPGSGIAYSLSFPEGHQWQIESNLTPLPALAPSDLVAKGMTAAGSEPFRARGASAEGAFMVQVRVDEAARRMVPPPFLFRKADFNDNSLQKNWPWLTRLQGDLGVFLDFAAVKQGTYDFGLDLLLSNQSQETFSSYGPAEAQWVEGAKN